MIVVTGIVKLALEAGKATPAPPVGPALGAMGVNIMSFCKEYNARTADKPGYIIPVEITVFDVGFILVIVSFLNYLYGTVGHFGGVPQQGTIHFVLCTDREMPN